jgi:MOSC domain-containing protein YiiM
VDALLKPLETLEAGIGAVEASPKDIGTLDHIVRRLGVGLREALREGELDEKTGLTGDDWLARGSSRTPDRSAHPDMQLTIMNSRVIDLVAGSKARWELAGDQLYVDFDISVENLPSGARLAIGQAIVEITPEPHTGCKKFMSRYGSDAVKFVNSPAGKKLRLRGLNARVIRSAVIRVGDAVKKL